MSLIRCPDCHKKISDNASFCPHCGYVLTDADIAKARRRKQNTYKMLGAVIVVLFALTLLGSMGRREDAQPASQPLAVSDFGFTKSEFVKRYNRIAASYGDKKLQLRGSSTKTDELYYWLLDAGTAVGVTLSGQNVDTVQMYRDKTNSRSTLDVKAIEIIIGTLDKTAGPNDCAVLADQLITFGTNTDGTVDKRPVTKERNGIEYTGENNNEKNSILVIAKPK